LNNFSKTPFFILTGGFVEDLGMLIRVARVKAGINQTQLAKFLNASQMTISKWERGVAWPQKFSLRKLTAFLNLDAKAIKLYKQLLKRGTPRAQRGKGKGPPPFPVPRPHIGRK
jgi:ribosome-binding protein aMBF1 (putative translation factor)